jgi:hypothetical protein
MMQQQQQQQPNHFSHNAAARQYAYNQPVCALLFQFTVQQRVCCVSKWRFSAALPFE